MQRRNTQLLSSAMEHPVTVRADQSKVAELSALPRSQLRERNNVVALDEALADTSIEIREIEAAHLAAQMAEFFENLCLLPPNQRRVALPGSVQLEQDLAFRGFSIFITRLRRRNSGVLLDGHSDLAQPPSVIGEFVPNDSLVSATPREPRSRVGRIKAEEVAQLHVDAVKGNLPADTAAPPGA